MRKANTSFTEFMKKHKNIPEAATWSTLNNQCEMGEYLEWDLNGNLLNKRTYDRSTGKLIEQHDYFNGKITRSKWHVGEELFESFYHPEIHPPVVKVSRVYRNHDKDRVQTIFDETGRQLYSVRDEKVTARHCRRYYNGILVYEGVQQEDDSKPPFYVRYFYPGGATLINYTSNGDGTGVWRLYNEDRQEIYNMPEADEQGRNAAMDWDEFMPTWFNYGEAETHMADWEAIKTKFKNSYYDLLTNNKIAALKAPAHLQAELNKIDWDSIKTSHNGGSSDLPPAIIGILSEDEDVAIECTNRIWYEIEDDRTLFESTFRVGIMLARVLPFYIHIPKVRQRIIKFLFNVVAQPFIKVEWDLYEELIASFERLLPLLLQWADEPNPVIAQQAQYILIHAGKELPETEVLLIKEWKNTSHPRVRRGYAAFALGSLYAFNGQPEKMIAAFSAAFRTETDALVRLILAIYLVSATKEEAQESWLTELFTTLTGGTAISDDFNSMQPFSGDSILHAYILQVLHDRAPEVLEKNIVTLITTLLAASRPNQEPLFEAICTVLLGHGHVLNDMEPLTRKVLLAIADVVEKDADFVAHHRNWFWNYSVPQDAALIRELAAKAAKK